MPRSRISNGSPEASQEEVFEIHYRVNPVESFDYFVKCGGMDKKKYRKSKMGFDELTN